VDAAIEARPAKPSEILAPFGLALVLAIASEFAGLIHLAYAREHLHEWVPFGLFFLASGFFQVVWAVMVFSPRARTFYVVGLVANLATVAVWAITRTVGLPFGPERWTPEVVGPADLAASALELVIVAGCVWALALGRGRRSRG
jgi:hypothetical protein